MDGRIWMSCPQTIAGLTCLPGLVSTLESCVTAPIRGVNVSTIAGSPRGSSATGAEVNANVSPPPVGVRSTIGPPAVVFIPGTSASVSVLARARYAEGVLDAWKGSVSATTVSRTPVGARSTCGWAPITVCWSESTSAACTSPEDRSAGGMPEVTGSASPEGRRPSRIPEVTGSSPKDRSTTVVRLASPLRPSSAVIAAVEVMVASSVRRYGPMFPTTATTSPEHRSAAGSRPSATGSSPEDRSTGGVLGSVPGLPTTATISSPEDRSAAGNEPAATDSSPEDHSAEGVRAGLPLDAPRGAGSLAAGDRTLLVATAVDSSRRLDFGTDDLEVARLFLGLLSAGSGVLLRGTSGSRMISLLLLMFLDCFVEML